MDVEDVNVHYYSNARFRFIRSVLTLCKCRISGDAIFIRCLLLGLPGACGAGEYSTAMDRKPATVGPIKALSQLYFTGSDCVAYLSVICTLYFYWILFAWKQENSSTTEEFNHREYGVAITNDLLMH